MHQKVVVGNQTAIHLRKVILRVLQRRRLECDRVSLDSCREAVEEGDRLHLLLDGVLWLEKNVTEVIQATLWLVQELDDVEAILRLHHLRNLTWLKLCQRLGKRACQAAQCGRRHLTALHRGAWVLRVCAGKDTHI